jgi:hypothetical protein
MMAVGKFCATALLIQNKYSAWNRTAAKPRFVTILLRHGLVQGSFIPPRDIRDSFPIISSNSENWINEVRGS